MFSGTPGLGAIRYIVSAAASNIFEVSNLKLLFVDVSGAFLYGDINRAVYTRLPDSVTRGRNVIGRLQKALYGLRDAPQIWKAHLTSTLRDAGFTECEVMPCVYLNLPKKIVLAVHVDDIIGTGSSQPLNWRVAVLKSVYAVKISYMGWNDSREGTFLGRT